MTASFPNQRNALRVLDVMTSFYFCEIYAKKVFI